MQISDSQARAEARHIIDSGFVDYLILALDDYARHQFRAADAKDVEALRQARVAADMPDVVSRIIDGIARE